MDEMLGRRWATLFGNNLGCLQGRGATMACYNSIATVLLIQGSGLLGIDDMVERI